jgi:uncharacterized protein YecT (DUF1311 family)
MSATHHKPAPKHNNQQPKQSFMMAKKWRAWNKVRKNENKQQSAKEGGGISKFDCMSCVISL